LFNASIDNGWNKKFGTKKKRMNSLISDIQEIISRDLGELSKEVNLTRDEDLWKTKAGINNPVGTLAFHLCGNLRHFIGAVLGEDGYQRKREEEFGMRTLTKGELMAEITCTKNAVEKTLGKLDPNKLNLVMPDTPPQHNGKTIGFFLVQLCCHLSRHRGQLDYLRRILQGENQMMGN